MPKVSVIIPVFNRETYIAGAVNSTLVQSFRDLELIIIDDGSTDRTPEVLDSFDDPRIRILRSEVNSGIPAARNKALSAAGGRYIAWLDSDDIMDPDRIRIQTGFLDNHAEVAMVGSCARKCDANGRSIRGIRVPPLAYDDVRAWLLFRSAFQHSSVMGRSEILKACQYREEFAVCEDLDVFIRLAADHILVNLPELLVTRRIHEAQSIRMHQELIQSKQMELLQNSLIQMGMDAGSENIKRHVLLANLKQRRYEPDMGYLDWVGEWLTELQRMNEIKQYCSTSSLAFTAGLFWSVTCWHARKRIGLRVYRKFINSSLSKAVLNTSGRSWLKNYIMLSLRG